MRENGKKHASILCSLLVCMMISSMVFAQETDYTFDTMDYAITGYNGNGGNVVIPDMIQGCPVESITSSTFYGNDTVTSLQLPQTLITLENSNFYMMDVLEQVILPESLVIIDSYNFFGCPNVTEVTVPSGVAWIGDNSFNDCPNLQEIRFNGVVPKLGVSCFEYLAEDVTVYVPDDQLDAYIEALPEGMNIQSTGESALLCDYTVPEEEFEFDASTGTILSYYGYGTRVDIPSAIGGVPVTAIGEDAFVHHPYLYYVSVPEGVISIGANAFNYVEHLSWVDLPSTLKRIESSAFGGFKGSVIEFPEGLEYIGDEAFYASVLYKGIYLPEGLTTVGNRAFYMTGALEAYFPSTIENIGEEAFGNTYINYLYFEGEELPQIAENAFDGLSIADVDISWKASRAQMLSAQEFFDGIGQSARVWRMQNPNVDYVRDGLDVYENGVLTAYTGDQSHLRPWDTYDDVTVTAVGDGAFKDNTTIEYFAVPYNDEFTTIGAEAFAGSTVQTVDLFDSVTTIGAGAFRDCTMLDKIVLPESVTSIGEGAFSGCTALTKLVLPASSENLDAGAFDGVDYSVLHISDAATDEQVDAWNVKLGTPWYDPAERISEYRTVTEMPYPETVPEDFWYDSEYKRLDNYDGYEVNLYLPRSIDGEPVEIISANVASSSKNTWEDVILPVKSIVIPETAKELVSEVFCDCPDLEVVICYAPLDNIPASAFRNCTGLREVVFVNGVLNIGMEAFSNCPSLETVYLGYDAVTIDPTAFDTGFEGFAAELPDLDALLEKVKSDPIPAPVEEPETPIPELNPEAAAEFLGVWNGISMEMEGTVLSLEELGMTADLCLNEDGTVNLIMDSESETMFWCAEEGIAYIGTTLETAEQAVINEEGMLLMSGEDYNMLFVRGEISDTAAADLPVLSDTEAEVQTAEVSSEDRTDVNYVCTYAEVSGIKMDASALGGEYSVTFCGDGTLKFVMAGTDVPGLKWTKEMVQTDNGEAEAYTVTYFDGSMLNFVFTEEGFVLNFFDSMLMYFEK